MSVEQFPDLRRFVDGAPPPRARKRTPIDGAEPSTSPDGLPRGFALRDDGIHRRIDGDDGAPEWVWLCSRIVVLALTRSREGEDWGRLVEIVDPDARAHRWAIPAQMFAGDGVEVRAGALRLGLRLAPGRAAREAFSRLLLEWAPAARTTSVERFGWVDDALTAFALGDGRVIGGGEFVHQSEHAPTIAREMCAVGSLEEWRATVGALCVGNPLLVAAVSAAFAGPLLAPLDRESAALHFRGASSCGKSTALRVAASVWGAPGFVQTWRATDNGLEGVAAACNSTLLALDEMGEAPGKVAGGVVYMLMNGQGKKRAARSGATRAPARWRLMALSSGEIALADKLAEAGERSKAGQDVRLLDIPADGRAFGAFDALHGAGSGAAFADRLTRAAATNYGVAGPAFVEVLAADLDGARDAVRRTIEAFRTEAIERQGLRGADGQVVRALERFEILAAAGEAATAFGLTGWPEGEACAAAATLFDLWLSGRGGAGPAEACEAIARVRRFIAQHGASRFERIGPEAASERVPNRAGWVTADRDCYFIASDIWRAEVHAGADPKRAAQHLADAGHLIRTERDRLESRTPSAVQGRPRAYAVRASILGAGDV